VWRSHLKKISCCGEAAELFEVVKGFAVSGFTDRDDNVKIFLSGMICI